MDKHNLCTKKITEFTKDDTIYIKYMKDDRKPTFLCQFVNYNPSNSTVTGKILDSKEFGHSYSKHLVGQEITAGLKNCALFGNATDEDNRSYYRWFDRSLYAMHPLEEHKVKENDVHISKHPAFGIARFSRVNHAGGTSLFGSSIVNNHSIIFSISRAEHDRTNGNDWFHARNEIIEIEMSQTQFADLITSFNYGSGIPVTIRHLNHEIMPEPPYISKADIFNDEFTKGMHNFTVDMQKTMEQALDILKNKSSISKGDRDVILDGIESLMTHLKSNIPFVQEQFQEAMERTVTEAKGEIEAFVEGKIRSAGLNALGFNKEENTPQIDNRKK